MEVLQTDRKTEQTRQTAEDRQSAQRKQNREVKTKAALALEAILAGGSWEQIPTDGVLSLSHTMGNGALLELFAMRDTGPEAQARAMPRGGCEAAPADWNGGAPALTDAPVFAAMSPMGITAPVEL